MFMKTLTARDASVLAVIADSPALPRDQRKRLISRLSSAAKPLAEAIEGNGALPTKRGKRTSRVAKALRIWSESNRDASRARMLRRLD